MAATSILQTFAGFPYDPEVVASYWDAVQDPVLTAMLQSGAVVNDANIKSMISKEGCLYTTRFDNPLDGKPDNYDGETTIQTGSTSGGFYTGVVYGRARAWTEKDFKAIISGHDPMAVIAGQVGKYWNKYRQKTLIDILGAIGQITTDSFKNSWKNHIVNLAPQVGEQAARKISATDLNDLATAALGDHKSKFSLAIMHSAVANTLENMQVLEYWKYTDSMGIQRNTNIANVNGYTVIIDDGCPVKNNVTSGHNEYTTYLLGEGAIRYAPYDLGNLRQELERDALTNGGQTTFVTRIRETFQPQGFSYVASNAQTTTSPTEEELQSKSNWKVAVNPKNIAIGMLITNG